MELHPLQSHRSQHDGYQKKQPKAARAIRTMHSSTPTEGNADRQLIPPERGDELMAHGLAYGQSRNICNAHWFSDVEALRKQQAQPNGDCTLERQALER